jgi:hypothetical protein
MAELGTMNHGAELCGCCHLNTAAAAMDLNQKRRRFCVLEPGLDWMLLL